MNTSIDPLQQLRHRYWPTLKAYEALGQTPPHRCSTLRQHTSATGTTPSTASPRTRG